MQMEILDIALAIGIATVLVSVGMGAGYLTRYMVGNYKAVSMERKAKDMLDGAKREAHSLRQEAGIHAKAEVMKARDDFEKTTKTRRKKLLALEERISQREMDLDRKVSMIDKKEQALEAKFSEIERQTTRIKEEREEVEKLVLQERAKLQRVAGMTQKEAKESLMSRVEKEVHGEMGGLVRRLQEQAKQTAQREAQKIIALSIQRYASSHASQMMTSTVILPSDDMKGRIIGRDGRNIRALEAAIGVNILIDDSPDTVVISGFDPVRREIGKQALESLISDGRIHPARIEEIVAKVQNSMDATIRSAGEETIYMTGVQDADPELSRVLGRLKFRTSYSQNVLQHSMEVSQLMGVMAGELGLDISLAKRIGLFHDIGKSLDHEVEGGHAIIGADLLKRHGEIQVVVNAVAAHHEEVEAESLYAVLASAADTISGSRLGARSETTDIYVKRLEKLENIAKSFDGVQKGYAIQAGREVRVVVEPEKIDDGDAIVLARNISKKIESELQYPGQIRVIVIRETRCVEYAR